MKHSIITLPLLAILAACSSPAENDAEATQEEAVETVAADYGIGGAPAGPVYTKNQGETLALSGYDAVSYFTGDAPVEGNAEHSVRYQGYDYHFASAENAEKFKADPAKFAPQYGGYCAWAMGAKDALAPGDPKVYKVVDGKLYLNFSEDVSKKWAEDIPGFIKQGDVNYPKHDASEHYKS